MHTLKTHIDQYMCVQTTLSRELLFDGESFYCSIVDSLIQNFNRRFADMPINIARPFGNPAFLQVSAGTFYTWPSRFKIHSLATSSLNFFILDSNFKLTLARDQDL